MTRKPIEEESIKDQGGKIAGSNFHHPALICPYTLMEEEALAWAILLFGQAILLHPYPLPLPVSVQSLMKQRKIQVRSLKSAPEAIREKDRILRGIKQYVADNPGRGLLKYLEGAASLDEGETREEITAMIQGRSLPKTPQESFSGPILLGLVHEWMMQEREVETSLASVEEQEKKLIQGWQENPEEEPVWNSVDSLVLKGNEAELNFPPALAAWWELKNNLVPEPVTLFTAQRWVWAKYYGLDPEETWINFLPLPRLDFLNKAIFQNSALQEIIQEKMEAALFPLPGADPQKAIDDFQKVFSEPGWSSGAKYRLVLPPPLPASTPSSQRTSDPMILLLPSLV